MSGRLGNLPSPVGDLCSHLRIGSAERALRARCWHARFVGGINNSLAPRYVQIRDGAAQLVVVYSTHWRQLWKTTTGTRLRLYRIGGFATGEFAASQRFDIGVERTVVVCRWVIGLAEEMCRRGAPALLWRAAQEVAGFQADASPTAARALVTACANLKDFLEDAHLDPDQPRSAAQHAAESGMVTALQSPVPSIGSDAHTHAAVDSVPPQSAVPEDSGNGSHSAVSSLGASSGMVSARSDSPSRSAGSTPPGSRHSSIGRASIFLLLNALCQRLWISLSKGSFTLLWR